MTRRVKFIEGASAPAHPKSNGKANAKANAKPETTADTPRADGAASFGGSPAADRRLVWLDSMRPFRARHERDVSMESALQAIERELRNQRDTVGDVIDVWNRVAPPSVRDLASVVGVSAGTLTLAVASSGAAYEIGRVLRDGLERQMVQQMPARVKRIKVRVVSE